MLFVFALYAPQSRVATLKQLLCLRIVVTATLPFSGQRRLDTYKPIESAFLHVGGLYEALIIFLIYIAYALVPIID